MIVLDTLAQTIGAGDENGAGMTAFVANAGELAGRFNALVLIVHHTGLGDDKRMRGHSSLNGALDAQILCERVDGDLAATLTLQKLKDDASDVGCSARLSRVVIALDEDGDEISTLVVDAIEDAEFRRSASSEKRFPALNGSSCPSFRSHRRSGRELRPLGQRADRSRHLRRRGPQPLLRRIAEQAEPAKPGKTLDRRRRLQAIG